MHSRDELFLCSLECSFCLYFPRCFATWEINIKITLSWALKQFVTLVHILCCINSAQQLLWWCIYISWSYCILVSKKVADTEATGWPRNQANDIEYVSHISSEIITVYKVTCFGHWNVPVFIPIASLILIRVKRNYTYRIHLEPSFRWLK